MYLTAHNTCREVYLNQINHVSSKANVVPNDLQINNVYKTSKSCLVFFLTNNFSLMVYFSVLTRNTTLNT